MCISIPLSSAPANAITAAPPFSVTELGYQVPAEFVKRGSRAAPTCSGTPCCRAHAGWPLWPVHCRKLTDLTMHPSGSLPLRSVAESSPKARSDWRLLMIRGTLGFLEREGWHTGDEMLEG